MANYTLDFTGAEVNELLHQVAGGGGGAIKVNISFEGMDDNMALINATADKSYSEIMAVIESGGFAFATLGLDGIFILPLVQIDTTTDNTPIMFSSIIMGMTFFVSITNEGLVSGGIAGE